MELWQLLLILLVGLDVLVQFNRYRQEKSRADAVRELLNGLNSDPDKGERPLALLEMSHDLAWIKTSLNTTYNLIGNETNRILTELKPPEPVKKRRK